MDASLAISQSPGCSHFICVSIVIIIHCCYSHFLEHVIRLYWKINNFLMHSLLFNIWYWWCFHLLQVDFIMFFYLNIEILFIHIMLQFCFMHFPIILFNSRFLYDDVMMIHHQPSLWRCAMMANPYFWTTELCSVYGGANVLCSSSFIM